MDLHLNFNIIGICMTFSNRKEIHCGKFVVIPGRYRIKKIGEYYYLKYGALGVKWDVQGTWFITVSTSSKRYIPTTITGVCGNMDNNPLSKFTGFYLSYIKLYLLTFCFGARYKCIMFALTLQSCSDD